MAAIDKIYGNSDEYFEFYNWVKDNCDWILTGFYYEPEDLITYGINPNEIFPLTNLSTLADVYLLGNCPINWVRKRINEQYFGILSKASEDFGGEFKTLAENEYQEISEKHTLSEQFINWRNKGYPLYDNN